MPAVCRRLSSRKYDEVSRANSHLNSAKSRLTSSPYMLQDGAASDAPNMPRQSSKIRPPSSVLRRPLQRKPAIFAVAQARFLEVEVALDPAPALVGKLALAQQRVNELP